MDDDEVAVAGKLNIEFDGLEADVDRVPEAGNRVFGGFVAGATVADDEHGESLFDVDGTRYCCAAVACASGQASLTVQYGNRDASKPRPEDFSHARDDKLR